MTLSLENIKKYTGKKSIKVELQPKTEIELYIKNYTKNRRFTYTSNNGIKKLLIRYL